MTKLNRRQFLKFQSKCMTAITAAFFLPKSLVAGAVKHEEEKRKVLAVENPVGHHCDGHTSPPVGKDWHEVMFPIIEKRPDGTVWMKRIFVHMREKNSRGQLKTKRTYTPFK